MDTVNRNCYRCGEKFYRGHLGICKAMDRSCFNCNKVGHLSKVCKFSRQASVSVVKVVARKSAKKKERDQQRWNHYKARKSEIMELPFSSLAEPDFRALDLVTMPFLPFHLRARHVTVEERIDSFKEASGKLRTQNKNLSSNIEHFKSKNKALEKKISEIELQTSKEIFSLENENQKLQRKLDSEGSRLNSAQEQLRVQEAAYSETVSKLNKEVESLKSKMIENERINSEFESFLRDQHEDEMKELVTRHKKEMENLHASMEPASASACAPNYNAAKSRQHRGRGGTRHRGRSTQSVKTPTITRMIIGDDSEPHEQRKYFPEKCYCPQVKSDGPGSYHMHFGPQCKIDRPADGIPKVSYF